MVHKWRIFSRYLHDATHYVLHHGGIRKNFWLIVHMLPFSWLVTSFSKLISGFPGRTDPVDIIFFCRKIPLLLFFFVRNLDQFVKPLVFYKDLIINSSIKSQILIEGKIVRQGNGSVFAGGGDEVSP